MTWNDRLSFCQNDSKKKCFTMCWKLIQMIILIFIHLCFEDKYILFTEFRIKFWSYKSGFFFKNFFVCFNLIKAVFSTNAREMRITFLSFDLLLDFVLKTDLIRSEQSTNVSKISRENISFFAGTHG